MNPHEIIIIQGTVVVHPNFDYRIRIATFLDFTVCICRIAHQRSPAELEIAKIVGMIYDLRTVRVHIERTELTSMPNPAVGLVSHISFIVAEYLGDKGFWSQFIHL